MQYIVGFIGLTAASFGAGMIHLFIKDRRRTALQKKIDPDYEWHFYQRGLDVMRRKAIDGSWQYRPMTDKEHRQHIADRW